MSCPRDSKAARAHHEAVTADAATGTPVTPEGQYWLATRRPWPGLGQIGECTCLTSLVLLDPDVEAELAQEAA